MELRGASHGASFCASIDEKLRYTDLDQRVLELAKQKYGEKLEGKITQTDFCLNTKTKLTPQNLLTFEIFCMSYYPENYNYTRNNGSLFNSGLEDVLSSVSKNLEAPHDLSFQRYGDTKIWLKQGWLAKHKNDFEVRQYEPKTKLGFGFELLVDNNCLERVDKKICEEARSIATSLIDREYKNFVKILQEKSY